MIEIVISDQTDQPQYMQLYSQLRDHIRNGIIRNGTKLPSVRALQAQLNCSKTPIETAYQMLVVEGYAVSKPRSGLYAVAPHVASPLDRLAHPESESLRSDSLPLRDTPAPPYPITIDFDPAAVDKEAFPVRTWKKVLHDTLESKVASYCGYGDLKGEYELRSVLADYVRQARGVECTPDQIVISVGIASSIRLLTALLDSISSIAIEEPGFRKVREQLLHEGLKVVPVPVGDLGISVELVKKSGAEAVYVTPSHQYPTGSIMPYAERERLLEWANATASYIIEDDYDGEFRYQGRPIPSLQSLDRHGRVIYIGTFSKAFTPALRMNYMVLPRQLSSRLESFRHLMLIPSRIDQMAMKSFIEQGHWYRHIRRMRKVYRRKHHHLIELLSQNFGDKVTITGHSAGLHIGVEVRTGHSAAELLERAAKAGVRVYDFGHLWMTNGPHERANPNVYFGFAGINEKEMEQGIKLLHEAWKGI
ncbi:PLP-dependent aminotransferase family protein [Paenibacillus paeoniae]|uniref:PLP-dependent aminotransferase family protein n=1 Tax=Paenibacillus paeoniae TaxID=2292705 RepID=A0A371PEV0_9BACL|nr:PLP-dependent aminotransferase family protein [Paenibacillus paeoniae]REK74429.1 PLP-dependent aminotransferase family protein [Paenibacillus paeoniae]